MSNAKQFVMDTGETITVAQAVTDPRNVDGISESALRSRLYSGVTDPQTLWGRTNVSGRVYKLDDGDAGTVGYFTRSPRNVHKLGMQTIRSRLFSGVTDPDMLFRRLRPHHSSVGYPLDDGTTITPSQAVCDPRNVHRLSMGGLRNRLQRGITNPEELFAQPNRW
jgi:hypothetical protein